MWRKIKSSPTYSPIVNKCKQEIKKKTIEISATVVTLTLVTYFLEQDFFLTENKTKQHSTKTTE